MICDRVCTAVFLIATCGASAVLADTTYDVDFLGDGTLPTQGSFTYDSVVPSFSNFTVTWNGVLFDLTASANAPMLNPPDPSCLGGATGAAATFALLSGDCDSPPAGSTTGWVGEQNI